MSNIDALADSVERTVKGYIGERFKAFEAGVVETFRQMVDALPKPRDGADGKSVDEKAIVASVLAEVSKALDAIPIPQNGKDADPEAMRAAVQAEVARAVAALPAPEKGKDADPEVVRSVVRDEVSRAVAALPLQKGEDGKSVDLVELSGEIMAAAAKAVAALPVPTNGRDFDPLLLRAEVEKAVGALPPPADAAAVRELVERAVNAIPRPQDGKSVDPEEVERLVETKVEKAVATIPKPKDGENGKDYDPTVLRAECLLAARAAVAELPPAPAGKDADQVAIADIVYERMMKSIRLPEDGKSVTVEDVKPLLEGEVSRWELEFERRAEDRLQRAVDRLPKARDGVGIDDFDLSVKGEGILVVSIRRADGEIVAKEIELDGWPAYRDTYEPGTTYKRNQSMTYGGSVWVAKQETDLPPPGNGWRMAVKGTR